MKKLEKRLFLGILFVCLSLITSMAWAQSEGTLTGKAFDKIEKFALPSVKVIIVGVQKYGTTDTEGNFSIDGIPPGVYKVTFETSGYIIETIKGVKILSGETTKLDVAMSMGFSHEISVTARREKTNLQRVPINMEILTETELKDMPTSNPLLALNNVTGIDVDTGKGVSMVQWLSIEGCKDTYIKKMVDGVDVSGVVGNWNMLQVYPEEMIDQIEIIKGGSSSIWGANMGGVINIVTKRPKYLKKPIITLSGAFSKYGKMEFGDASIIPGEGGYMQRYSTNIMGNYQNFSYLFGVKRNTHDGFSEYGKESSTNILAKVGYYFNDTTYIDVLYNYNDLNYKEHTFLKTDLFGPSILYYYDYKRDTNSGTHVASLKFSSYIIPEINIEAQLKLHRFTYDDDEEGLGGLISPPITYHTEFVDQKLGFSLKGNYRPNETFSLISGIDYYRIKADYTGYVSGQPVIYVDSLAPFVNLEYRMGSLDIHAGARYDYDSSFGSQLSPSFGTNLNLFKATILRLNVSRTFQVPFLLYTLGETFLTGILPNPDLKPERGWSYSAGIETQELKYIWVKLSAYHHKITNGILTAVHPTIPDRLIWSNIAFYTKKGYEAEVGIILPFGLTGYLATNRNTHRDDYSDAVLTRIPTRTYKTGLKYKNRKIDLSVNLRGRWIWWNNETGLIASLLAPRDKRWVFDLRISKGFNVAGNTKLVLYLDVFNLTNQLTWQRADFPNPRRWMVLGFDLKI